MNSVALVSDLMTTNIETISASDSLQKASDVFNSRHFRHLPVVEEGRLEGILSQTDFENVALGLRLANKTSKEKSNLLERIKVAEVMTSDVYSVTPQTSAEQVMKVFREEKFHAMPVVDEGEVVGIISHHDVFYYI